MQLQWMKREMITWMQQYTNNPTVPAVSVSEKLCMKNGWLIWNPFHHPKHLEAQPKVIIPISRAATAPEIK